MAGKDEFDGQISLFGMDDMDFDTIGITGGADVFEEEEIIPEKSVAEQPEQQPAATVKRGTVPKLKIEGVFVCMGCGKLLTKTIEGDRFKAFCNCCNVTYAGNQ